MTEKKLSALVVDDEPSIVRVVEGYLVKDGFEVRTAADGETALALAQESEPDVVVLDLGLPGMDGIEVCRRLRTFSTCYILMLTARADEVDMLIGLAVGADDYVIKPFSPRALVARVRTLLRRPRTPVAGAASPAGTDTRVFGQLVIDVPAREVRVAGSVVPLTRTEYELLEALSSAPRMVFTRAQLLDRVWEGGAGSAPGDEHLVDIHVGHLRHKLGDDPRDPRYVLTIRGVGYRMGPG
ncbi:DNA-binding response regulator, OmpR family, contains REC and winged-helix (wHTH) domain [Raineyella antarctica]|uniref:DNA-binding response regulator, OmpR family, contains REC and winged-helix (WHTH) domain n=1 Tax=Raineyella antarctica TaxID=1577474 RepID=A0A1G6GCP7_9ACTN|nr:response regulator transcription factor [Raineyella antarctica]SDB79744.1 DNA-binding response regulator, OmpR family, contains REC and winged-helix (wHTH) domain [Raineyella antarctica]